MLRPNAIDLTGQRFGKLTVIRENGRLHNAIAWECQCDCGAVKSTTNVCHLSRISLTRGSLSARFHPGVDTKDVIAAIRGDLLGDADAFAPKGYAA